MSFQVATPMGNAAPPLLAQQVAAANAMVALATVSCAVIPPEIGSPEKKQKKRKKSGSKRKPTSNKKYIASGTTKANGGRGVAYRQISQPSNKSRGGKARRSYTVSHRHRAGGES